MTIRILSILLLMLLSARLSAQELSQNQIDSLVRIYNVLSDNDPNKLKICDRIAHGHSVSWWERPVCASFRN